MDFEGPFNPENCMHGPVSAGYKSVCVVTGTSRKLYEYGSIDYRRYKNMAHT